MLIAVSVLSVLFALSALLNVTFFRAADSFEKRAELYRDLYIAALATIGDIKNKLAAEGILLVSAEEAAKLTGDTTKTSNKSNKDLH